MTGAGQTAVFDALRQRDPRLRRVVSPDNLSGAAAADLGIEQAQSDVIVRLNADDVCMPGRLGKLVAAFEEDPRLGMVGSAVEFINEAGEVVGRQIKPEADSRSGGRFCSTIHFIIQLWASAVATSSAPVATGPKNQSHTIAIYDSVCCRFAAPERFLSISSNIAGTRAG
jgi:glycosyltransferase involved in cell wall biosynthesis